MTAEELRELRERLAGMGERLTIVDSFWPGGLVVSREALLALTEDALQQAELDDGLERWPGAETPNAEKPRGT